MGKGTRYPFVIQYLKDVVKPGFHVLETGCGGALYRENILTALGSYVGCDVPNPYYQSDHDVDAYCDGNRLAFANNSFDFVFNQGAFDYIPNPKLTISETFRVLRPGGVFTIFTYREDVLKTIDSNCKFRGRAWEKGHHVYSIQELQEWLSAQGFQAREITLKLDTIQSVGWKRDILDFFHVYMFLQSKVSIWRVVEARKPA